MLSRVRRSPEEVVAVEIPVPQGEVRRRLEQRRAYRRARRYRLRSRPARFDNRRPPKCGVCGRNARRGTDTCRHHRGTPRTGLAHAASWMPPSVKAREDDHVVPRSRGGTNAWENPLPACRACNQAKGNRTPEEWGVRPRVEIKPLGKVFRMATWAQQGKIYLLWRLRHSGVGVTTTYGAYTAWTRKVRGAEKDHLVDAGIIALSEYPSLEVPEVPLAGLRLDARPAAFRPRQVFKAERYPEGRRPSHAVRLPSGWARPVRVKSEA